MRPVDARVTNAQGRQWTTRRCAARHGPYVIAAGEGAIFHLSGGGVRLLPKKEKCRLLNLFEQLVIRPGVAVCGRRSRGQRGAPTAAARKSTFNNAGQGNGCGSRQSRQKFPPRKKHSRC